MIGQHVLAHLIVSGGYDRHLRRQRAVYSMRRSALVDALQARLPAWTVRGTTAGLHLWVEPPGPVDDAALAAAAAARGVLVLGMSSMRRETDHRGLVLGFARLRSHDALEIADTLARAVEDTTRRSTRDRAAAGPPGGGLGGTGVDFFEPDAPAS